MNASKIFKPVAEIVIKNSPAVLTAIGTAGFVTTVFLAVDEKTKAEEFISAKKKAEGRELTKTETAAEAAKAYWPAMVTGTLSLACFIFSNHLSLKRQAALIAAYKLSEDKIRAFQEAAVKTVGESKANDIRDAVAKDAVRKNPTEGTTIIVTGGGDHPCYDMVSGRYFKSSRDKILKAQNEINRRLFTDGSISLNEFYDELNLPAISIGDKLGWNCDKVYGDGGLDIRFTTTLDDTGTPCLVMEYELSPTFWFDS